MSIQQKDLQKVRLAYKNMIDRCYNPKNASFKHYGGRGISVCNEWLNNRNAFEIWAFSSGHAKGLSLDRIDNEKGYSPDNCRWVGMREQLLNQRRNRIIEFDGVAQPLSLWAEKLGVSPDTLSKRLSRMQVDAALKPGKLREWKHGTRHGYETGCRCDFCKSAHAARQREARARRAKKSEIQTEKSNAHDIQGYTALVEKRLKGEVL